MRVIILFFSLFFLQSQKILVLNNKTDEPIQSANIFIYKDGKNIKSGNTDDKGEFYFNTEYDSIVVHSIGFEEKKYIKNKNIDIIVRLKEKTTALKEVIVTSKKKKIILGEYKKESSETRVIGKAEQFALYFKKPAIKIYKITSIFLNLKKVPYNADLVVNFYTVDSIKREYLNQSKHTKSILTEIIPDKKNKLGSLLYKLTPNSNKEILKINLDSLALKLPGTGIFVSLYIKDIYDNQGNKKPITSIEQLPLLYKHKTKENNYCEKLPNNEDYWQNLNLVMRYHEDTDKYHPLIPMSYYEPSIGIKIEEMEE